MSVFVYNNVFVYFCTIISFGTFGFPLWYPIKTTWDPLQYDSCYLKGVYVNFVPVSLSLPSRFSQTPVTCRGTFALSTWGRDLTPAPTAARPSPPPRALNNTNTSTLPSSPSYVSHSDPSYVSPHAFYSEHHTAELESSSILLKFPPNF